MPKPQAKMRKFRKKWLKEDWARGWLVDASEENKTQDAYCKICRKYLRAHKTDLQHHSTKCKVHSKNFMKMFPNAAQRALNVVVVNNKAKEKEMNLALHVAMHSAIQTIDHLAPLFNKYLEEPVQIHRTKCSAILKYVIAPSLLSQIINDVGNMPYSLILDESTDISIVKYLCICIKYFSRLKNEMCIYFIGLIEIEKSTSKLLYDALKDYLTEIKLPISNIVGLGTDGGSNLCGKNNSVYTLLKQHSPNLILIRCICHYLNNINSFAAEQLPCSLDFVCREIYNWFSLSATRRIEYKRLYDILNDGKDFHKFIKLSTTRWLCRYNVVRIILEHYDTLNAHFKIVVNKEKCYTARQLNAMLEDKNNHLYLIIIKPILYEFNKLNLMFQKDFVEIGESFEDVKGLVMFLARKIFKEPFHTYELIVKNIDNELAFLDAKCIDFGIDYRCYTSENNIDINDITTVLTKSKNYMICLCKELIKKLPEKISLFKNLQAFSPKYCLSQFKLKFETLPFLKMFVEHKNLGIIENQYNSLIDVPWAVIYGEDVLNNSLLFWRHVLQHKNAGDVYVFKELAEFVILLLSLPSSNAVVERVFSIMNATKTKVRNRMDLDMLNALLLIKIYLFAEKKCCNNFTFTKDMFLKFNSNMYNTKQTNNNNETDCISTDVFEIVSDEFNIPCLNIV